MTRAAWWVPAVLVATGCAARVFTPPSGSAEPFADAPRVWEQMTARCRDARLYQAELRVQGWVGATDQRIANTLHGAVTRADEIYLELRAFGSLVFEMAGQAGQSTILLPRDARVLRAPTRDIVSALTGLAWGGRELLDVLSGCVAAAAGPVSGMRAGAYVQVALSPTAQAWLRERDGRWRVHAAQIDGWTVEYRQYDGAWPVDVRVTAAGAAPLDLRFSIAQIQVNIDLPASAFEVNVPSHFQPMTLDDLRAIGPLRERTEHQAPSTEHPAPSTCELTCPAS